ncbi:MAG: sensor histidine kinase [Opitutae bacterium]|nr:sensor histidine kinase [Opitutae bacterium]
MRRPVSRFTLVTLLAGCLLVGIFAAMVWRFRTELRAEFRQNLIERDASVLHPVALQKLAEIESTLGGRPWTSVELVAAVVKGKWPEGKGILAVAIFDAQGVCLQRMPATLLFADLPADDYVRLQGLAPISRFHPRFPLHQYFAGVAADRREAPVLEVLLPLYSREENVLGFAQYYIEASSLALRLAELDQHYNHLTLATLGIGAGLIALVVVAAYFGLRRAQRVIAERTERLTRANFELTLAAKASALGQITSHLLHGLQGPVAGLRAVVAEQGRNTTAVSDWQSAADYTERMQALIQETVAMLGDASTHATYELTGRELAETIRHRNSPLADRKGVQLVVGRGFDSSIDNHRGSLLCLITNNLVQNAIENTPTGRCIAVQLRNGDGRITLTVADEGPGISDAVRAHLFEPGRSGRPGGTGLGLAISQLLARQIGAELILASTGPSGTAFRITLPLS